MKTCPKCGTQFGDEMSYCLNDGMALTGVVSSTEQPTAQYGEKTLDLPADAPTPTQAFNSQDFAGEQPDTRFQPPEHSPTGAPPVFTPPGVQKKGSTSRYVLPIALAGLAGLFFLGAAGVGVFVYMSSTGSSDVAMANTNTDRPIVGVDQNTNSGSDSSNTSSPVFASNTSDANTVSAVNSEPKLSSTPQPRTTSTPNKVTTLQPEPTVLATPPVTGRPTPRTNMPKTISGGVLNGKALSLPKPPYPPAARAVRASGSVSVQVLIDEDGRVISASAVSGHPLLRGAAEQAARGARFSPTMLSGQPVKVSGIITYNFVP